jgi:acetyl-CoA acetyltransferase family protein
MAYDAEVAMKGFNKKGAGLGATYEGIVIVGAKRTPFCKFGQGGQDGVLGNLSGTDLGIVASRGAIEQSGIPAADFDHVCYAQAGCSSGDKFFCARHVGLYSGIPFHVPALLVQKICTSSIDSLINGVEHIATGKATISLTGGCEGLTQAPVSIFGARQGFRLFRHESVDYLLIAFLDTSVNLMMGETAENVAKKFGITREECDEYGCVSMNRANDAQQNGYFEAEITPVKPGKISEHGLIPRRIRLPRGVEVVDTDDGVRGTSMEALAKLRPAFIHRRKDMEFPGVQTAGNSSQITDGGASIVVTTAAEANKRGIKPIGRVVASASAGLDPAFMGLGPIPSCKLVLEIAGMKLEEMDIVEINEAFAAQYIACEKELGLDREVTNINGGAISFGHPYAATGARLTMTLLYNLRRLGKRYGMASACIGGGMGTAIIVEAFPE